MDALLAFRSLRALPSWEAAVTALLESAGPAAAPAPAPTAAPTPTAPPALERTAP